MTARAVCIIPNCGKLAPAGAAFCADHRDQPPAHRLEPWTRCPSSHCERRGECASPSDCIVTEPARDRIAAALDARLKQHALDREPLDPGALADIAIKALGAPATPQPRSTPSPTGGVS